MSRSVLRLCLGIVWLALVPLCADGQQSPRASMPRTLHGQIRFANGGAPAQHVIVRLERFHGGIWGEVVTDATGKYDFSGMTPEQYVIIVRLPGYLEQRREVDLQSTNNAYELFQLLPVKSPS